MIPEVARGIAAAGTARKQSPAPGIMDRNWTGWTVVESNLTVASVGNVGPMKKEGP